MRKDRHRIVLPRLILLALVAALVSGCDLRAEPGKHGIQPTDPLPSLFGLVVSPIQAHFDQATFTTTYRSEVSHPNTNPNEVTELKQPWQAEWTGPNCGTHSAEREVTLEGFQTEEVLEWSHPHPPCAATTDHSDVTIRLEIFRGVYGGPAVAICTYKGSQTGTGPPCTSK